MFSCWSPGRRSAATAVVAVAAAAVGLSIPAHAASASAQGAGPVTLRGEVVHGLSTFPDLGAVAADRPMRVAVALAVDTAARDAAYTALYTKGSPSYHAFYTPAQFREQFGAAPAVARRVLLAVTADGLQVAYSAPDGSYVELTGTTGQVERTFDVAEHSYRGMGGLFTANAQAPTVPAGVAAVLGLTSLTRFTAAASQALAQDICVPAGGTAGGLTAGPAGACLGETQPSDLWSVYDQPGMNYAKDHPNATGVGTAATPSVAGTDYGAGAKVAIFGEGQLKGVVSDLRGFEKLEKLPTVPVREVLVGDNLADNSGSGEWDLDSDASTGMAPDLQELDYYFGSDLSDASIGGTYSAWANDPNGPATGNSSFGGAEGLEYLGGFILDPLLQQAAMEGRTMFASSGDVGGDCLPGANGVASALVPCVEYPASSPYVVGVGGTVLYTATTDATGATQALPAQRADEYSWNFSGGGQSQFEVAPPWQVAALPLSTPCTVQNTGQTCRGVPDVSAQSGDITTNSYVVYTNGAPSSSGGTSLSSPLWAGMWSRVVAAHPASCAASATNPHYTAKLGFAQEDLYNLGNDPTQDTKDFFDVGQSVDSMPATNQAQVSMFRSALDPTGYDFISGLGTPDVTNMTKALDCGNTTAVTPDIAEGTTSTTIGSTFVYNLPAGCPSNGTITDPAGDEVPATPTNAALDITTLHVSNTSSAVTFAATVSNLSANPGDLDYAFEFKYGAGAYAVDFDRGISSNTFALDSLTVTSTPIGLGAQGLPTQLSTALTGTVTGNTLSVTMPLSVFNTAAKPAAALALGGQLTAVSLFTNNGPGSVAIANDFNVEPIDQAEFFQCPYTLALLAVTTGTTPGTGAAGVGGGTAASGTSAGSGGASAGSGTTHELAFTGLSSAVPLAALVLVGSGLLLRRRSRRIGA